MTPQRFLGGVAAATTLLLASVAAVNAWLDPFEFLRPAAREDLFQIAEFQIPGIARHHVFRNVIVGSSITIPFDSREATRIFGGQTLNFAVAGSGIVEQARILEFTLRTRPIDRVIWPLDAFALNPGYGGGALFPDYLYDDRAWNDSRYLLSGGALAWGVRSWWRRSRGEPSTSLDDWIVQRLEDERENYGEARVLESWNRRSAYRKYEPVLEGKEIARRLEELVTPIVRRWPEVRFDFVLPPYSSLYFRLLDEDPPASDRLRAFNDEVVAELGGFSQVRVHDFQRVREYTDDLARYKDLIHFSGDTATQLIRDIAHERFRVTAR